jgi:hypothetical protein
VVVGFARLSAVAFGFAGIGAELFPPERVLAPPAGAVRIFDLKTARSAREATIAVDDACSCGRERKNDRRCNRITPAAATTSKIKAAVTHRRKNQRFFTPAVTAFFASMASGSEGKVWDGCEVSSIFFKAFRIELNELSLIVRRYSNLHELQK